jgi:flagellar motor component MotA
MKKKLQQSLKRDEVLFQLIKKYNPNLTIKKFIFRVKISKNKYLQMIKNRYISTLLNLTEKQIKNGLNEIDNKYKKKLNFKDQLICLIIKNN